MKLFFDANALFSASNVRSNFFAFLAYLSQKRITLVSSSYAIAEAQRNLERKKPEWLGGFARVQKMIVIVPESQLSLPTDLAAKDQPILAAAIYAKCDYLLTGDKRGFGHLYGKMVGSVKIVSYKMLLTELDKKKL